MARSVTVTVKPPGELVELLGTAGRFEASNVTALERAADLANEAGRFEPFILGDLDPVVVPRSYLERLIVQRNALAAALDPFLDDEEARKEVDS